MQTAGRGFCLVSLESLLVGEVCERLDYPDLTGCIGWRDRADSHLAPTKMLLAIMIVSGKLDARSAQHTGSLDIIGDVEAYDRCSGLFGD